MCLQVHGVHVEDWWELVLSFHYVAPGDRTQAVTWQQAPLSAEPSRWPKAYP